MKKNTAQPAYQSLLKRLSVIENRLLNKYKKHIVCGRGCFTCCKLGSVFAVEAAVIRGALSKLSTEKKARLILQAKKGRGDACVFLLDGACSIYRRRPVICRTHGYPLLIRGKVSFCKRNFKKVKTIASDCITDLERLNLALAAMNVRYLGETGIKQARFTFRDLLRGLP